MGHPQAARIDSGPCTHLVYCTRCDYTDIVCTRADARALRAQHARTHRDADSKASDHRRYLRDKAEGRR